MYILLLLIKFLNTSSIDEIKDEQVILIFPVLFIINISILELVTISSLSTFTLLIDLIS